MSFMSVMGMKYHCTECNEVIEVRYSNTPQMLQIGDIGVMMQFAIQRQLAGIEVSTDENGIIHNYAPIDPDINNWLHEFCICETCYKKVRPGSSAKIDDKFPDLVQSLNQLEAGSSEAVKRLIDVAQRNLNEWFAELFSPDSCRIRKPDEYDRLLGKSLPLIPDNIRKISRDYVSPIFLEYRSEVEDRIRKSARLYDAFKSEKARIELLAAEVATMIDDMVALNVQHGGNAVEITIYTAAHINRILHLNPFIDYELTRGVPVENTPATLIYRASQLDIEAVRDEYTNPFPDSLIDEVIEYVLESTDRLDFNSVAIRLIKNTHS